MAGSISGYKGKVFGVLQFMRPIAAPGLLCMYELGSEDADRCGDPSTGDGVTWYGSLSDGQLPFGAFLYGDAVFDPGFGLKLDGAGDFMDVTLATGGSYANDAR